MTDNLRFYLLIVLAAMSLVTDSDGQCQRNPKTLFATTISQTLRSPQDFMGDPLGRERCNWRIQADHGFRVHLILRVVHSFRCDFVSSCCGHVNLYDGSSSAMSPLLGHMCNADNRDFYSTGQYVYVEYYKENGASIKSGFQATYQAVSLADFISTTTTRGAEDHNSDTDDLVRNDGSFISVGAIIGAIIGVVVSLGFICILLWRCGRCVQSTPSVNQQQARPTQNHAPSGSSPPSHHAHRDNQRQPMLSSRHNAPFGRNAPPAGNTLSAGIAPSAPYDENINIGFSSSRGAPPSYETVMANDKSEQPRGGSFTPQQTLPSYSDAIVMSDIAPKPV